MDRRNLMGLSLALLVLAVAGGFLALAYGNPNLPSGQPTEIVPMRTQIKAPAWQAMFAPPAAESAPGGMRALAMRGYAIMMNTKKEAKDHVGDKNELSCRNCHFDAGRDENTVSLVGVSARYPMVRPDGTIFTLEDEIQDCFRNELAGKPPAKDSDVMRALSTYLTWISKGVPVYGNVPWLDFQPLEVAGTPDPQRGVQRFTAVCSRCHGPAGGGTGIAPPLVGPGSFTTGASMASQPVLAAFVHRFMPYKAAEKVSTEAAADIAAFLLGQPRPAPPAK